MRNSNIPHDPAAGALRITLRATRSRFRAVAAAFACALAILITPTRAAAQVTPADSAGVLVGVAGELRAEGRIQLARTLLELVRERYPNTPAANEAVRLLAELRGTNAETSGRAELMVFGATYGAWVGVAIPIATESDSPEAYGLGLIAGAPAGFLLARAYARSRSLTEGQARAITFGGSWGTWQGFGWQQVLDIGQEQECFFDVEGNEYCSDTSSSGSAAVTSALAGGLIGIGVGAVLSQKNITAGTATTVNFGALWGTWFGSALGILADQEDDALMTSALLGGNAGILATALLAPRWQLSRSRARLISISGVAGLLAGFGTLLIVQPDSESDSMILIPMLGSAAGLALGARWTRGMDRDAMIDVERGKLGFELPSIQPTWVEARNGSRSPALGLTLIKARF